MKPSNTIRWTEACNPVTANIDLIQDGSFRENSGLVRLLSAADSGLFSSFFSFIFNLIFIAAKIARHERLYLITCAIADSNRFQMMNLYNAGGLSSSLAKLTNEGVWYKKYTDVDPRKGFSAKKNPDFHEAAKVYQPIQQIVPVFL